MNITVSCAVFPDSSSIKIVKLYVSIGKSRPGIYAELPNGINIRHDIDTDEVIGFMIYNYSRKRKRNQIKEIPHFPNFKLPDFA